MPLPQAFVRGFRRVGEGVSVVLACLTLASSARAQGPAGPYPPMPANTANPAPPGSPPPPGGPWYPPSPTPAPYGYGAPPPSGYGPPPQGAYGAPGYPSAPPMAPSSLRSDGEMNFLLGTGALYGVGAGIAFDLLAKTKDPAVSLLAPMTLGAGVPIGLYFLDREVPFHRGVPASISVGTMLGTVGGFGLSTMQYTLASSPADEWTASTYGALTFLTATGGAVGGYAFGELLSPNPKGLGFIASGAGWGLLTGSMVGAGVSGQGETWRGASVGGVIGYGAGIAASGAISTVADFSWAQQKWMWAGYSLGVASTSVVYAAYLFSDGEPKRGLIANGLGGLAGLAIGALLARDAQDDDRPPTRAYQPPFHLGATWLPGGGMITAQGTLQ